MAPKADVETELYRIEWDDELDAVHYTWTEFASGETFREGANALLDYVRDRGAERVIVDTSGIEAHDDDDQRWLQEEWTPKLIDEGATTVAMVRNESVIAKMDMESFMAEMEDLPYDAFMTDDMAEAREWVAEH